MTFGKYRNEIHVAFGIKSKGGYYIKRRRQVKIAKVNRGVTGQ